MLYKLLFLNAAGEVIKYKYYGNLKTAERYMEYHREFQFAMQRLGHVSWYASKLQLEDGNNTLIKEIDVI